jgi:DNA-directed RNA polymerase specialized sigma subunit
VVDRDFTEEEVEGFEKLAGVSAEELKNKRSKEVELLSAFKKSPSQSTFMPLYQSFKPLILKAAQRNMYGSPIPQAAHTMYAAQSFLDAVRTHDPAKGGFTTHMFNTVFQKGKRLNLHYQNIGYIPESRATKYQAFQTANYLLKEQLGREPSTLEIADEMAIAPKEIERMRKEIRQDLIMNEALPTVGPQFAQSDKAMNALRDIQYSLIPKHRIVLERTVGLNGVEPLSTKSGKPDINAIAKAANLSVAEVRSARKTISRKLEDYLGHIGKDEHAHMFGDEDET